MTFLQAILLQCLQTVEGERTVYSVYHLLKGKKSSQTIQDAHLFSLKHLFKSYSQMDRAGFDRLMSELAGTGYIEERSLQRMAVTGKGREALQDFWQSRKYPEHLNGWVYQDASVLLWKRLTLFIQSLSHLINRDIRYMPVQRDPDVQHWIKEFFISYPGSRHQLADDTYNELVRAFSKGCPDDPGLLVSRLSGYGRIGLTHAQAAELYGMEPTEFWYRQLNLLHFLTAAVSLRDREFPVLHAFVRDEVEPVPLTQSALSTYRLLKESRTIEEIAAMRRLKKSTIEDHVIEISLNDRSFAIDPFIARETAEQIRRIAKSVGGKRLKPIKDRMADVTYFQIRLALTKQGDGL